ncbi:MAG: response regulator transcription factor [Lachnospiraceae bacterium]|nr:response regulator transcription factor [Lachnospiraceae bacterium]
MKSRILIIEDEFNLADMIKDWFEEKGVSVEIRTDGNEGYACALSGDYDAIILDVMLPGMDGFSILKMLKANNVETPVLMLTARSELRDKLKGFKDGACDYLTKPFAIEELDARVNVMLMRYGADRRGTKSDENHLEYEDLILDVGGHILRCKEKRIQLSQKEAKLMEYFMKNHNQVLSKEQITIAIWGADCDAEYNHEEVYISFLRKKLKYLGTDVRIETVRGAGYYLKETTDK